ncbi:MAG TPA: tRNA pseudouridine(38-40) synthase TruA [Pseudobdellovibrionaceae bacterium]|nr:tRNA pseudouridine(38-40) synthase TruA [Pseudobdellovibrionaceae bacterium]
MTRIRFLVSYDGTDFCGWQKQSPEAGASLQQTLEEALGKVFNRKIDLSASGRTDAGVHALGQVCHFDIDLPEEKFLSWDFCWAMQGVLKKNIVIRKAWIAPMDFHATLSATHKTYRYFIYNHPRANPFWARTSHWVRHPLDLEFLQRCADRFLGEHDFKSFQTAGTPVLNTVRTIHEARWERRSRNVVQFTITGSGFLKQMVRNIVGTQLQFEKFRREPAEIARILAARDRQKAGATAPPQGLLLWKVFYPVDLDKRCRPL